MCGPNCVWADSLNSNSTDVVRAGGEKTLQFLSQNSPNSLSITAERFTCSTVRVAIKTEQASTLPFQPTSIFSVCNFPSRCHRLFLKPLCATYCAQLIGAPCFTEPSTLAMSQSVVLIMTQSLFSGLQSAGYMCVRRKENKTELIV